MNRKNYTSIKKVITDLAIKSGNKTDFNPDDVLYLANGIAERIITGDSFIEGLALIEIDNYKGALPSNFKYMSQALYREDIETYCTREEVTELTKKIYGTDCSLDVNIRCDSCSNDCNTQVITMDADYNYLLNNPKWMYNHSHFFYGQRNLNRHTNHQPLEDSKFKLMRRTTNYFFNIPYHINECINLNHDTKVEYNIEYPNIVTNFKKGQVLIAYLGVAVDDEGYRMIPDIEEVYEAIYYSIRERMIEIKFDTDQSQNSRIALQLAEQKAKEKRRIAKSKLSELEPDEWEMFIRNHWVRTVPNYKWERNHNNHTGDSKYSSTKLIGRF